VEDETKKNQLKKFIKIKKNSYQNNEDQFLYERKTKGG
jgi:hypothetical protein